MDKVILNENTIGTIRSPYGHYLNSSISHLLNKINRTVKTKKNRKEYNNTDNNSVKLIEFTLEIERNISIDIKCYIVFGAENGEKIPQEDSLFDISNKKIKLVCYYDDHKEKPLEWHNLETIEYSIEKMNGIDTNFDRFFYVKIPGTKTYYEDKEYFGQSWFEILRNNQITLKRGEKIWEIERD